MTDDVELELDETPGACSRLPMHRLLTEFLDKKDVKYRSMDHPAEGQTTLVSALRGHAARQAAKCMVIEVRGILVGIRHVLAVVPGDRRVDFRRIRTLYGGTDASLADREIVEDLTGCIPGCVIPVSFRDELRTVFDPILLEQGEIFFNAARLDQSVALSAADLVSATGAVIHPISRPVSTLAPRTALRV